MTDQDIVDAVASKLTSEFYVGQRVRTTLDFSGTITGFGNYGQGEHAALATDDGTYRHIFLWALRPVYDHT